MEEGVRLYLGGDCQSVQGRRFNPTGPRCFSPLYGSTRKVYLANEARQIVALLDSGAFSDPPERRLSCAGALARQLAWEEKAARAWGATGWQAEALVSYDLLIDEKWTEGRRRKQRWSVTEADEAVRVTIEAAAFLAEQRQALAPRRLVLAAQGVDHVQYAECAAGVLEYAQPGDILGLGGWCIIGKWRSWLPQFWATMRRVLPLAECSGLKRVHLFGVTYRPALGGLLWLCDQHGLKLSTDSAAPVLAMTMPDQKRAGAVRATWEENCQWWREQLGQLRQSAFYRQPPAPEILRQGELFALPAAPITSASSAPESAST